MDCREASCKRTEWKGKHKEAKAELQQAKMRLNVKTGRLRLVLGRARFQTGALGRRAASGAKMHGLTIAGRH